MTFDGTEIREIYLSIPSSRKKWESLLALVSLAPESKSPDLVIGLFDDENLLGTASLDGNIIKYVAIDPSRQGEAIANRLLSEILSKALERGIESLAIFTKPEYSTLFSRLSFREIGRSPSAVMLENDPRALGHYKKYLSEQRSSLPDASSEIGVIVMNTNPPTVGHIYLIHRAAREVDHLFIIPVTDNPETEFGYVSRRKALTDAVSDLKNVTVLEGSRYCISSATFPSYFIKEIGKRTDSHILLDLDVFQRHIAPSLGATVRFVGEEPTDPLTARYNELMKQVLPISGIKIVEIPRLEDKTGCPVSASRVRRYIREGHIYDAFPLVPHSSVPAILSKAVSSALRRELELTPKPGLIDRIDNGAHMDMDYRMMERSIETLEPYFEEIARASMKTGIPDASVLQPIGLKGEKAMFEATGGINTHRGALFSLGLVVAATACLLANSGPGSEAVHDCGRLTSEAISDTVASIAATFDRPVGTHGSSVSDKYSIPTALDVAVSGYKDIFAIRKQETDPHRRLLSIMASLDDSNVYHRGGDEGADFIKSRSSDLLNNSSSSDLLNALSDFNRECIDCNLSPGGAADLLALLFLLDSILPELNQQTNSISKY